MCVQSSNPALSQIWSLPLSLPGRGDANETGPVELPQPAIVGGNLNGMDKNPRTNTLLLSVSLHGGQTGAVYSLALDPPDSKAAALMENFVGLSNLKIDWITGK